MSVLRLGRVTREIGAFVILDAVSAAIALGDRIGLVGPNGAGKTTLLRIAAGLDEPDRGEVGRKRGLTIGLLAQEAHLDASFMAAPDLRSAVGFGAAHLDRMATDLAELERAHRAGESEYADLQHRYEVHGGYTLDQRVDETLSGLGFARSEWSKAPTALSGGEQTRAALARLVIADPELLLLDEPTNHLDLDALEWLETHLRRRTGSLVVASHDRFFLDATVTRIWELRDRRLTTFRGDYSAFHRQREERDTRLEKDVGSQAEAIAREQDLVQRYRSHRKFAKMHEHEARLERLQTERMEGPKTERSLRIPGRSLAGSGPQRSGEVVVRAEGLVIGYLAGKGAAEGERGVAKVPFLAAQRGERIGVVGPNGAGKTTLLRTIAGDLPPLDGTLTIGTGVEVGYLAQLRDAGLPGTTVLDAVLGAIPVTAGQARSYLAQFLFRGDDVLTEVRSLSGGERSRLELALLGIAPANVLLLDEPTNHLDIPAREAIEAFLRDVVATVLVVSHDRRLLETICDRLWVVDDGCAAPFDGGYRAWRAAKADGWTITGALEAEARRLRTGGRPIGGVVRGAGVASAGMASAGMAAAGVAPPPAGGSAPSSEPSMFPQKAATATNGARRVTRLAKLSKDAYRRQRSAVDSELTRLGLRKGHLELVLGDPAVASNFVELRRISSELADVSTALEAAEQAWLELEERAP